jgi:hypothetical protein
MIFKVKENEYVEYYIHLESVVAVKFARSMNKEIKECDIFTNCGNPIMAKRNLKEQYAQAFYIDYMKFLDSLKEEKKTEEQQEKNYDESVKKETEFEQFIKNNNKKNSKNSKKLKPFIGEETEEVETTDETSIKIAKIEENASVDIIDTDEK